MISTVTKLDTHRKAAGGVRKHPPLSKPKGIVKDHRVYRSETTRDPDYSTPEDVAQRLNAMELTMFNVLREMQIIQARDPYATAYRPSNVIPMNTPRMGPAKLVSVPGNEAEVLDLPSGADTTPRHIPYAGFNGVHPPETVRKLQEVTSVSPDDVADIAWQNGLDLVELTDIAHKEFTRRELSSYDIYGKPRDEVRFNRLTSQYRQDTRPGKFGPHVYHRSKDSCFKAWAQDVHAWEGPLRLISIEKLMSTPFNAPAPPVPGEAVARARYWSRRRDEVRAKLKSHKATQAERFREIGKVSKRLSHGAPVTTRSQAAALGVMWRDTVDTVRHTLDIKSKARFRKKRLEYTREARRWDPNSHPKLNKALKAGEQLVRTGSRTTERWHDLGTELPENARDRMNYIGNLLIRDGESPLNVSAVQAYLLSLYGDSLLVKAE